jgi:hypothetical protein
MDTFEEKYGRLPVSTKATTANLPRYLIPVKSPGAPPPATAGGKKTPVY